MLETSARTWVAKRVDPGETAALSNRVTLRDDWHRSSPDVDPGTDFDKWRDPQVKTLHADRRLGASERCLAKAAPDELSVVDVVAHLRDHDGDGPPPPSFVPFGEGVTVCMHLGRHQATTASMVVDLPVDEDEPVRVWAALGSPCVSVFIPCLAPHVAPAALAQPETWRRFARLARVTEGRPDLWVQVRAHLRAVEAELWEEAASLGNATAGWQHFVEAAWPRVDAALRAAEAEALVA